VVGEKDWILGSYEGEKSNDRILVRVDPTLKMSTPPSPSRIVMIQKDLSSTQRYGFLYDQSVVGGDVVPKETSSVGTVKAASLSDSMVWKVESMLPGDMSNIFTIQVLLLSNPVVQIVPPSNDHTSDIFSMRY